MGKPASSFVKPAEQGKGRQPGRQPTIRQIKAAKLMAENVGSPKPKTKGEILLEAGYSPEIAEVPAKVLNSPTFQDLLNSYLPDKMLARTHKRLLTTRKLEHMVFPLGPIGEDDENLSGAKPNAYNPADDIGHPVERTTLTDAEIKKMLKQAGCDVKRIVHGETARHVYFWTHDAKAQASALELAYKMKGLIGKGGEGTSLNFNFGTQNFVKQSGGQQ